MSQLVANINGIEVYSDKAVSSIVNTRVTFTDGSWCDVATGQIVNKGPGYINIGSPEEGTNEKVTVGPRAYSACKLEVRDVIADLDVQVHETRSNVEVIIVGPANEVKRISVAQQGDTVVIKGEGREAAGGGVIIISRDGGYVTHIGRIRGGAAVISGGVVIGGQGVVITGEGEHQTKITVRIPKGASVAISNISGFSSIGNTGGNLQVNTTDGNVVVGCVANATLNVQGSSDITVQEVNGLLSMNIMGSGNIKVHRGSVSALTVQVMGSGDASFNGQAETATLLVMGSGDIRVASVENRPSKSILGSGDIHVGNW